METTFAKLKKAGACMARYKHLAKALGGINKYGKNTPITALQILNANGLYDCLWAAHILPDDRLWRHFAADCAEQALPIYERQYPDDFRPRAAIQAARDFADGKIDDATRINAWKSAKAAAWNADSSTTWNAAWAATRAAALNATRAAAWVAAKADAWNSVGWQHKRLRWYLTQCEWGPRFMDDEG